MHYFEEKLDTLLSEATATSTFNHHIKIAEDLLGQIDKKDKIYITGDSYFSIISLIDDLNDPHTGFLASIFNPNEPRTEKLFIRIANLNEKLKSMWDAYSAKTFNEEIKTGYLEVLQDNYKNLLEKAAAAMREVDLEKYPDSNRLYKIFVVAIKHIIHAFDVVISIAQIQARQRSPG